jgi:flagellar biosynthetic protein FliP
MAIIARPSRLMLLSALLGALMVPAPSRAQELELPKSPAPASPASAKSQTGTLQLPDLTNRENAKSTIQVVALLAVLSIVPAVLLMVTSFTRIIIVLTLLRQALGAQQLPPNQVLAGLAIFMTFAVMTPTWHRVNNEALQPYLHGQLEPQGALTKGIGPVRDFMAKQIERAGNDGDVDVFTDAANLPRAKSWNDVPTTALVPAFMLSELKTAFAMGFKIYLPFLVIDLVVSMLLVSMGMMMMPPVLVSLPFKLLLFVMVDGWRLITSGLLGSFVS